MSRRKPRPSTERPAERLSGGYKPPRDPGKPALNLYSTYKCPACMGMWLGVELDNGVTPTFSPCFALQGCRGTAFVTAIAAAPPSLPILVEWYEPTTTSGLSFEMKEHVRNGGLVRRATKNAPDWVKRIA